MSVCEHLSTVISSCAKSILCTQNSPGTWHEQRSTSYDLQICYHIQTVIHCQCITATDRHAAPRGKRGIRSGLCGADVSTLTEMVDSADYALFQRILYNPNHVLHSLLPDLNATGHYLRHRRHGRVLSPKTGRLQINNFLIRQLYKDL